MKVLFPEARRKALTFSYDDGTIHDRRFIALFNQYGMKGTFNLNSGLFGQGTRVDESEVRDLYRGHEVACHGRYHKSLEQLSHEETVSELKDDKAELERITGQPVRGYAHAYGIPTADALDTAKALGFAYIRKSGGYKHFRLPESFDSWDSTCHHSEDLLLWGDRFLAEEQPLAVMKVFGHSYEFHEQNNWDLIEQFCEKMSGKKDIWYATNLQICDYVTAARKLITEPSGIIRNPSDAPVWLQTDDQEAVVKLEPGQSFLSTENPTKQYNTRRKE